MSQIFAKKSIEKMLANANKGETLKRIFKEFNTLEKIDSAFLIYSNSINSSDEEKYNDDQNKFEDFIKNKKNYRDDEPEITKFNLDYNDDLNLFVVVLRYS